MAIYLLYMKDCFNYLIRKEFFFQSSLLQKKLHYIGCAFSDSVPFVMIRCETNCFFENLLTLEQMLFDPSALLELRTQALIKNKLWKLKPKDIIQKSFTIQEIVTEVSSRIPF